MTTKQHFAKDSIQYVDWIESDGDSWIDISGPIDFDGLTIEAIASFPYDSYKDGAPFKNGVVYGMRVANSDDICAMQTAEGSRRLRLYRRTLVDQNTYWIDTSNGVISASDTVKFVSTPDYIAIYKNGSTQLRYVAMTHDPCGVVPSLRLFGNAGAAEGWAKLPLRLHNFKMSKNGQMIMNLAPVDYNGAGALLDKVSSSVMMNDGTGQFSIGPHK